MAGKVSVRVGGNVRRLRQIQDLNAAELSERLNAIGRPIGETGITRLETGNRAVDVDDLLALAEALEVPPALLLSADLTPAVIMKALKQ